MSAFRAKMQQHNNNKQAGAGLKVTDETLMLQMDNSFYVGTASMYSSRSSLIIIIIIIVIFYLAAASRQL